MGHICFEVKTAFLWQIFRHPYRKILTLYVIYAKLLLYLNNYRNTGAKQIRKLSAEPNKESGANPEQVRCRILSKSIQDVMSVTGKLS